MITNAPQPRTQTPLSLATRSFEAVGDVRTTFECELTFPTARASATITTTTTTTGFAPCVSPIGYANLSTPGAPNWG